MAIYTKAPESEHNRAWVRDLGCLLSSINVTSQQTTSVLSLLASSIANGVPLPPYIKPPSAYELSEKLEAMDPDILSINHMLEPGFSAFAVTQLTSTMISSDMIKLVELVLMKNS